MAAVEKLKQDEGQEAVDAATCAMGLSLGEYSALCFADALSFSDGVKITKARGEAMQAASDAADSGMVSVIGLPKETVQEIYEAPVEKIARARLPAPRGGMTPPPKPRTTTTTTPGNTIFRLLSFHKGIKQTRFFPQLTSSVNTTTTLNRCRGRMS